MSNAIRPMVKNVISYFTNEIWSIDELSKVVNEDPNRHNNEGWKLTYESMIIADQVLEE